MCTENIKQFLLVLVRIRLISFFFFSFFFLISTFFNLSLYFLARIWIETTLFYIKSNGKAFKNIPPFRNEIILTVSIAHYLDIKLQREEWPQEEKKWMPPKPLRMNKTDSRTYHAKNIFVFHKRNIWIKCPFIKFQTHHTAALKLRFDMPGNH